MHVCLCCLSDRNLIVPLEMLVIPPQPSFPQGSTQWRCWLCGGSGQR